MLLNSRLAHYSKTTGPMRSRYTKLFVLLIVVSVPAISMLAACGADDNSSTVPSDGLGSANRGQTCSNYDRQSWRTSYSWADGKLICQYAALWECFGLPRHLHPSQNEDDFARNEWLLQEVSNKKMKKCAAEINLSDKSLSRASDGAGSMLPPDPAPLLEDGSQFYSEHSSGEGFTFDVTLTVGELLDGRSAIERGFAAKNCEFNEQRDAVVPWAIQLTNTTADFDLQLNLGLNWMDPDSELKFTDIVRVDTTTGDHGCGFSGGSVGAPGSSACCNLLNPEALPPGETMEADGAVIVEDHFGPNHPEGDGQGLRDVQFSLTSEPDCLSGPGASDGWFSLVGVDLSKVRAQEEWVGGDVPQC